MKKIILGICAVLVLNGVKAVGSRIYDPLHDNSSHSTLTVTQKVWEDTTELRQLQPYEFENVAALVAYVATTSSYPLDPNDSQISAAKKEESDIKKG